MFSGNPVDVQVMQAVGQRRRAAVSEQRTSAQARQNHAKQAGPTPQLEDSLACTG